MIPAWQSAILEDLFHTCVNAQIVAISREELEDILQKKSYPKLEPLLLPGNEKAINRFLSRLNRMLESNAANLPESSQTHQIGSGLQERVCHVFCLQTVEETHERAVQSVLSDSLTSSGLPSDVTRCKSLGNTTVRVYVNTSSNLIDVFDAIDNIPWVASVSLDLTGGE